MISESEISERQKKIDDALPDLEHYQSLKISLYEDIIRSIISQNGITVRQLKGLLRLALNGKPTPLETKQLKSFCKCGAPALRKHTCPGKEDLDNDFETKCNCCEACQNDCARDV